MPLPVARPPCAGGFLQAHSVTTAMRFRRSSELNVLSLARPACLKRVFSVAAVCVLSTACSPPPAAQSLTLKQVGPSVWAAIDNPRAAAPAWANAGFVIGDDGVAVIDTLSSADAARQLLAEVRHRTSLPIRYVINTHYHADHVSGNGTFADTGAAIVAQRNVRRWIHSENVRLIGPQITREQKAQTGALVAPSIVFDEAMTLYLSGREVRIVSLPGHTGSDSIVVVPDARVVFAGDLLFREMFPTLIDASIRPWIGTLELLSTNYAGYTFVPGHGDVGTTRDVAAFGDYLMTLLDLVSDAHARGKSGGAMTAAVVPALKKRYGQWEFFDQAAKENVFQVEAELTKTKTVPR
jgi:cyclase